MFVSSKGIPYERKYTGDYEDEPGYDQEENRAFSEWCRALPQGSSDTWELRCFNDEGAHRAYLERFHLESLGWVFEEGKSPTLKLPEMDSGCRALLVARRLDFCWPTPVI